MDFVNTSQKLAKHLRIKYHWQNTRLINILARTNMDAPFSYHPLTPKK